MSSTRESYSTVWPGSVQDIPELEVCVEVSMRLEVIPLASMLPDSVYVEVCVLDSSIVKVHDPSVTVALKSRLLDVERLREYVPESMFPE
jgi:hypothetical protein